MFVLELIKAILCLSFKISSNVKRTRGEFYISWIQRETHYVVVVTFRCLPLEPALLLQTVWRIMHLLSGSCRHKMLFLDQVVFGTSFFAIFQLRIHLLLHRRTPEIIKKCDYVPGHQATSSINFSYTIIAKNTTVMKFVIPEKTPIPTNISAYVRTSSNASSGFGLART